jgi:hypothetical protein
MLRSYAHCENYTVLNYTVLVSRGSWSPSNGPVSPPRGRQFELFTYWCFNCVFPKVFGTTDDASGWAMFDSNDEDAVPDERPLPMRRPTSASTNSRKKSASRRRTKGGSSGSHFDDVMEFNEAEIEDDVPPAERKREQVRASTESSSGKLDSKAEHTTSSASNPGQAEKVVRGTKNPNSRSRKTSGSHSGKQASAASNDNEILQAAEMLALHQTLLSDGQSTTTGGQQQTDGADTEQKRLRPAAETAEVSVTQRAVVRKQPSGGRRRRRAADAAKRTEPQNESPPEPVASKRKSDDVAADSETLVEHYASEGERNNVEPEANNADDEQQSEETTIEEKKQSDSRSSRKKRKRKFSSSHGNSRGATRAASKQAVCGNPTFQLGTSENPEVKSWLKKKNRLMKRQLAEERRRERQRKKEEEEQMKQNELKEKESAEKVAAWMLQKKKEAELAQKQTQKNEEKGAAGGLGKIAAAITSTLGIQKAVSQIEVSVTTRPLHGSGATESTTTDGGVTPMPASESAACVNAPTVAASDPQLPSTDVPHSATAVSAAGGSINNGQKNLRRREHERLPSPRMSVSPSRICLPQDDRYPMTHPAHPANGNAVRRSLPVPSSSSPSASTMAASTAPARVSYEVWLSRKKAEDAARRKKLADEEEKRQSNINDATAAVVRDVARRRIDAILRGRRRIDTGVGRVDEVANSHPRTTRGVASASVDISSLRLLRRRSSRDVGRMSLSSVDLSAESGSGGGQRPEDETTTAVGTDGGLTGRPYGETAQQATFERNPSAIETSSLLSVLVNSVDAASCFDQAASTSAHGRPWSAFPARSVRRRPPVASAERPSTADGFIPRQRDPRSVADASPSSGVLDLSPTVKQLHVVAPRPPIPASDSAPYRSVRYQQRSWNGFADFVWDHVNETEGGNLATTPHRLSLQPARPDGDAAAAQSTADAGAVRRDAKSTSASRTATAGRDSQQRPTRNGVATAPESGRSEPTARSTSELRRDHTAAAAAPEPRNKSAVRGQKKVIAERAAPFEPTGVGETEDVEAVAAADSEMRIAKMNGNADAGNGASPRTSIAWAERPSETEERRDRTPTFAAAADVALATTSLRRRPASSGAAAASVQAAARKDSRRDQVRRPPASSPGQAPQPTSPVTRNSAASSEANGGDEAATSVVDTCDGQQADSQKSATNGRPNGVQRRRSARKLSDRPEAVDPSTSSARHVSFEVSTGVESSPAAVGEQPETARTDADMSGAASPSVARLHSHLQPDDRLSDCGTVDITTTDETFDAAHDPAADSAEFHEVLAETGDEGPAASGDSPDRQRQSDDDEGVPPEVLASQGDVDDDDDYDDNYDSDRDLTDQPDELGDKSSWRRRRRRRPMAEMLLTAMSIPRVVIDLVDSPTEDEVDSETTGNTYNNQ